MKYFAIILFWLITSTYFSQSRHELDSLFKLVKNKSVQDTSLAKTYNEIAYAYNRINIDSSKYFADKALSLSEKLDFKKGVASAYNCLGINFHMLSQYEKALEYYQKSKNIKEIIGDKKGAISSQNNMGIILYLQGHYDKALETFNSSLKIQQSVNDASGLPNTLNYIASVHFFLSNYERALSYYLQSLTLYQKTENKPGLCQAYNNIGIIYNALNNFDKAIENYTKSLDLAISIGDKYFEVSSYNNLGTVYQRKKDNDRALAYFSKSLALSRELKNSEGIADNLQKIGLVLESENKFEPALDKYTEALSIQEKAGNAFGVASLLASMGSVFNELNRNSESARFYERALKAAKELRSKDLIAEVSLKYASLLKKNGDFKKAYYYIAQYSSIKDSILGDEKNKSMAEMQIRFDTDAKEKEIVLLTKDKNIENLRLGEQDENIRKQRVTIYSTTVGILLGLTLGLFLLNSYRQKRKGNNLLEEKNRAINSQKKTLEEKNELIKKSIVYAKSIPCFAE